MSHETLLFSESQDLRDHLFHCQNAVPGDEVTPHDSSDDPVEEDTSGFLVPVPRRSVRISNLLGKIAPVTPATNVHALNYSAPDTYVHFTFDEEEWSNLSNEADPMSYLDAFSQPDAAQWQAACEDEMKSLHEHQVWQLVPHTEVPAGHKIIPSKPVFHYK